MEKTTQLKHFRKIFVALICVHTMGCASVSVSPRGAPPEVGPTPPVLEVQGPVEGQSVPELKPLVLVLSPGRALGFAHVGILRGLVESKVPVAAILSTEVGALIGGLYAATGKIQKLEWGLLRFREEVFTSEGGLLGLMGRRDGLVDSERLEKALLQTFGSRDLRDTKIPLKVFAKRKGAGPEGLILMNGGPMRLALRAALAGPGLFEASLWEGQKTESAAAEKPYPVAEAQQLFPGAIVMVVDSLPETERLMHAAEREGADFVIRPDFSGLGPEDFSKRNEIAFRGKEAIAPIIGRLRQSMGLPEVAGASERSEEE